MQKKYTIKEIAKLFNITENKLRFYEKKGLIEPERDDINNYRYYSEEDIIRLQTILMYRLMNIPLKDIEDLLKNHYKNNVLNHFYKQWEVLNKEIHRLKLIKNSYEEIMDLMYDIDNNDYEGIIIKSIEKMSHMQSIKESWKDKWNFDGWARSYDKDVMEDRGQLKIYKNYEEILNRVFRTATDNFSKESSVLEIGVGTGNLAEKLLCNEYNIIGIDQSREMLNVAKEKFPNLKLRLGDFLKIPFENNTFDIIVSTYAFHHLNNEEKAVAINELLRVLKEQGKIVIGDLMFENEQEKNNMYKDLTRGQIAEIEDEYYSDISFLKKEFEKYNKKLSAYRVDELNWIIEIL